MAERKRPTILESWDEPQHDPLTVPPDLEGLSDEKAVEAIKGWFYENFEDPVHSTPYVSAEGGYQYIWGGPYETGDVVENVFADTASEAVIAAAIDELEYETDTWVPSSSRRQPPDESQEALTPAELHRDMQARIEALEKTLRGWNQAPPGIGHNNPPEVLEPEPLDADDRAEILESLEVLKAQPVEPSDQGEAARGAILQLETKGQKLPAWLLGQGQVFTAEAVKEAGKQFGKWGPRAFWLVVLDQLLGVTRYAEAWLRALGLL